MAETFRIGKIRNVIEIFNLLQKENKDYESKETDPMLQTVYRSRAGTFGLCAEILEEQFLKGL